MAIKAVNATQLDSDLLAVANAIRSKAGISDELEFPAEFVSAIAAITTSGGGTGGGIQTASATTLSSNNVQYIQFNSIREVPDWFVVIADPAAATDYGTAYWYYTAITKSNNTISAVIAKAANSGGASTGGILSLDIKASGINAQYTTIPIGLKISGDDYFLKNTKYTIFYGSGSGSGSGGTGGITPSGNKAITASTSVQSNIDVTQYSTVSVSPTPTESKTVTLGASMPSTATPGSGKHLSQVSFALDTSVIKAANIASGVTILGVTGTHAGGGGSSGGSGNIGEPVDMTFTSNTPSNANGCYHYRRAAVDTTNLIGFYAYCDEPIVIDEDVDGDNDNRYLTGVYYDAVNGDGFVTHIRKNSSNAVRLESNGLNTSEFYIDDENRKVEISVTSGTYGSVGISTATTQPVGHRYTFDNEVVWVLIPIYSA